LHFLLAYPSSIQLEKLIVAYVFCSFLIPVLTKLFVNLAILGASKHVLYEQQDLQKTPKRILSFANKTSLL
jgi:phosphomevalonate kinase